MKPLTLSNLEIRKELAGIRIVALPDASGAVVDEKFLKDQLLPSWAWHKKEISLDYAAEARDCDKFARLFVAWVQWSVVRSRSSHAALVGWMGVTDSGGHAVNIVRTQSGWVEIEPQTGACRSLAPRSRNSIIYVVL